MAFFNPNPSDPSDRGNSSTSTTSFGSVLPEFFVFGSVRKPKFSFSGFPIATGDVTTPVKVETAGDSSILQEVEHHLKPAFPFKFSTLSKSAVKFGVTKESVESFSLLCGDDVDSDAGYRSPMSAEGVEEVSEDEMPIASSRQSQPPEVERDESSGKQPFS